LTGMKADPGASGLGVRLTHFARWLALFEQAALKACPPEAADFFVGRAHRIAQSLQLGIGLIDLIDPLTNEFAETGSQV
jgi:hypothetical protein